MFFILFGQKNQNKTESNVQTASLAAFHPDITASAVGVVERFRICPRRVVDRRPTQSELKSQAHAEAQQQDPILIRVIGGGARLRIAAATNGCELRTGLSLENASEPCHMKPVLI